MKNLIIEISKWLVDCDDNKIDVSYKGWYIRFIFRKDIDNSEQIFIPSILKVSNMIKDLSEWLDTCGIYLTSIWYSNLWLHIDLDIEAYWLDHDETYSKYYSIDQILEELKTKWYYLDESSIFFLRIDNK